MGETVTPAPDHDPFTRCCSAWCGARRTGTVGFDQRQGHHIAGTYPFSAVNSSSSDSKHGRQGAPGVTPGNGQPATGTQDKQQSVTHHHRHYQQQPHQQLNVSVRTMKLKGCTCC